MCRYADTAVFTKGAILETALRLTRVAGTVGVRVAVMVYTCGRFFSRADSCASRHDAAMIARICRNWYIMTGEQDACRAENQKKNKSCEIRTGVSGAWAGSPCSKPAFPQLA